MSGSLKDQISLSKDYLPSPARSTVPQLRPELATIKSIKFQPID
jgi:hypothetical protein